MLPAGVDDDGDNGANSHDPKLESPPSPPNKTKKERKTIGNNSFAIILVHLMRSRNEVIN